MGGRVCKEICRRASESCDALDAKAASTAALELELTAAAELDVEVERRSASASNALPLGVPQPGLDRSEDFKAAQRAVADLEAAALHCRASAWRACEEAWLKALRPKLVEEDKKISDLIAGAESKWFSFEYFPPNTDEGVRNLRSRIQRMKGLEPLFLDFTWGAGWATSDLTLMLSSEAKNQLGCVTNMHITCTNQRSEMIAEVLDSCKAVGLRNVVALRGDPPKWAAVKGGFSCALDLVRFIRETHGDHFCISVAGYPEGHPSAVEEVPGGLAALSCSEQRRARVMRDKSGKEKVTVCRDERFQQELTYLKEKCSAGADVIITQMFFDHQVFLDFVKSCRDIGIQVPIVPGIMMLNTFAGLQRTSSLCKSRLPEGFLEKAKAANASDEAFKLFGLQFTTQLCRSLLDAGAPGLHFYTLNLEKVVVATLRALDLISAEKANAFTDL
eukprot:TRINITY_DN101514_c0_g1_i1.p1 TRINITY_DN101514_c0_g1~~TRINITY_DN101514_c0_g1_i1.p1  ORF type:complete len:446 (+),score=101.88 TRINITY_DN101514_c0_g1_i1:37-1374(+)